MAKGRKINRVFASRVFSRVSGENPELNNLEDFLDNLDFPITQSNLGYCNYVPATGIERFQRRVQHAISLGYENAWRYSAYK